MDEMGTKRVAEIRSPAESETRNPKPEARMKSEGRNPLGGAKFLSERRFLSSGPFNRRDAKSAARRSRNRRETDRIMAGQNHGEPKQNQGWLTTAGGAISIFYL